eukprot:GHRR01029130.1.p1 GENE.GHRR01029130.1~~GHRR01029130.1.p1  ORF type:complete len:136 (-),score=10.67 GHRR01029130.1:872-1279(-)
MANIAARVQGRDGIGACPCCGTGVVFRRDPLVSMGGQSYGSITEDYNTAMNALAAGFATMWVTVHAELAVMQPNAYYLALAPYSTVNLFVAVASLNLTPSPCSSLKPWLTTGCLSPPCCWLYCRSLFCLLAVLRS